MIESYAPIAIFVYKRPEHTFKCLSALVQNKEFYQSKIYVFCDGPKENESIDNRNLIEQTRDIIKGFDNEKTFIIHENETNKGLANSLVNGINFVFKQHEKIIVIEDDILVSVDFLKYINWGLNCFRENNKIATIQGFQFSIFKGKQQYFLDSAVGCWGWATWNDRWNLYQSDANQLIDEIQSTNQISEFNINDTYNFFELLNSTATGKIDSWAIKWYASLFTQKKLNLYPTISFTNNIGNDGSGSHNEINYSNSTLGTFVKIDPNSIIQNERFQYKIYLFRKRIKRLKQIKNLLLKIKLKLQFLNG